MTLFQIMNPTCLKVQIGSSTVASPPLTQLSLQSLPDTSCPLNMLTQRGFSICLRDRLWFDELIGLWMSEQNSPGWEVVGSCISSVFIYIKPTIIGVSVPIHPHGPS